MGTFPGTCEIVESVDELDCEFQMDDNIGMHHGQKYSIEDDINRLFEAIDIRASRRASGQLQQNGAENFRKSAMKRPMRAGLPQAAGIGISESVSLKQALRGLCISQASEMAAMKRLSKPSGLSRVSESGAIKRLYRAVVVEASESGQLLHESKENLVEISLIPETSTSNFCRMQDKLQVEKANLDAHPSTHLTEPQDGIRSTQIDSCDGSSKPVGKECSKLDLGNQENLKSKHSPSHTNSIKKLAEVEEIIPASVEVSSNLVIQEKEQEADLHSESSQSSLKSGSKILKSASSGPRLIRPVFRSKKFKSHSTPGTNCSSQYNAAVSDGPCSSTSKMDCHTPDSALRHASQEKDRTSQLSSSINVNFEASLHAVDPSDHKPGFTSNCGNRPAVILTKPDERSRSKEKGEFSQSSKSSLGEYSSSTSFSEESNLSMSSRGGYRPHMSKDLRWEAIRAIQKQHGSLSLRHFKLLKKLGGGDIGTVYLAELSGANCLFALKIMDNEFLAVRKKMPRAQTEREIMQMLDHPFLPTLFAHFTTDKFSCLVMEYCPGGDLHVLRQRQPSKSFSEEAARFYVAEVLLALEYLHMLGVVYRDLKPENILVREDGHIMLTDFDLSLRCAVNPILVKSTSPVVPPKKVSSPCSDSSCIEPFCLQPSCFTPRLLSAAARTRKLKADLAAQVIPLPQLVVEPTSARSNSFVGTHEYLSPEIIKGEGHGSPVDWWTFGIFLYELLCGRTPFKGSANEDTLANVVSRPLRFPETPIVSFHARDLISRLLQKDPENRLGSVKGAAEIKHHPFFEGLNWALIRCATPPELPKHCDFGTVSFDTSSHNYKENTKSQKDCNGVTENSEFEMF